MRNKDFVCLIIGLAVVVASLVSLLSVPLHNYQVEKCHKVSLNQYYEAQADCFVPIYKPNLNIIVNFVYLFIVSLFIQLFVGFLVLLIKDFN